MTRFIRTGVRNLYKHKIELITTADIQDFVKIAESDEGEVKLIDGNGFCVNGKSLLGAMATVEWNSLYCETENDIYSQIQKYCVE